MKRENSRLVAVIAMPGKTMVTIITGGIDTGKTSRLLSIYQNLKQGDGFIIRKVFLHYTNIGQEIMRLSTGESRGFSFKEKFVPKNWDSLYGFGGYSFSEGGFIFARNIIFDIVKSRTEPVFIDEIGPLELEGKGFYSIFTTLLGLQRKMYAVVRTSCLDSVTEKFKIRKYNLIRVEYPAK